jgi:biofilm PGA synthesis N-glycosyltransferase PgaC
MAYLWMTGAIFYFLHYERREAGSVDEPPPLDDYPPVAVLIPCHNESANIEETVAWALRLKYPNFEVVTINDGSTDDTQSILERLAARHERVRVVQLARNEGKAMALTTGALLTPCEFLICIDGDAVLDPNCANWMMKHFASGPRVAAVTGNPRIRTRSTLLGRIQVGEFSSIIGLIKRAQRTYGRVFTVSGVVCGFRKTALQQVGYWSPDMLTEDIDISWKLQTNHYDVRFEPKALCWILMPETLKGLWRQRLRWAKGGAQVLLKNWPILGLWRKRRMWPVFIEYCVSVVWAYSMLAVGALWALGWLLPLPSGLHVETILPRWTGVLIGTTCLLQVAVSMVLDARYDKGLGRYYYWMIWYPLVYWLLNVLTTVVAVPQVLAREQGKRARWKSPDRGITA